MRGYWSAWVLLSWLLVHPYYADVSTPVVLRVWYGIQYRNTWIATDAYDTKDGCMSAARVIHQRALQELSKESRDVPSILEHGALAQARCVPADAVPMLPFYVKMSEYFGMR
jgi:hypothetical protein